MMTIAENTPDPTGAGDSITTSSTVTYTTSEQAGSDTVYYEYVLTLKDVKNPEDATVRDKDSALDVEKGQPSTASEVIWYAYEFYTTKFSMSLLYAKPSTQGSGNSLFTKAYGVYSSNWLGFKGQLKRLYVLNKDYKDVNGRLEVVAGQQSDWFYLATGQTEAEAKNKPVLLEKITFGLPSDT